MTTIFQPRTPQHKHQHLSPAETQLLDLALADVGPAPAADDPTHAVAVTTSADQHVTTTTTPAETLRLSEKEEHILQLYRDLQEQDLERELLEEVKKARTSQNDANETTPEALQQAQTDLLHARSAHTIRTRALTNLLTTDPVLQSIHNNQDATNPHATTHANLLSSQLLLSLVLENLVTARNETMASLTSIEAERTKVMKKNKQLADEMMTLVEAERSLKGGSVEDVVARLRDETQTQARGPSKNKSKGKGRAEDTEKLIEELTSVEADVKIGEKGDRVLKEVLGAVIAGSGVDWAQDRKLLSMVIGEDEGDEDLDVDVDDEEEEMSE